jgi:hypothetical protein
MRVEDVMDISSILSTVESAYDSSSSTSGGTTSSSSSVDFSAMTISQIRDMTDEMVSNGKLNDLQVVALSSYGLMDETVTGEGPSMGYTRADTGTYNVVNILNSIANFDRSAGDTQDAATFTGTAQAIQAYENNASENTTSGETTIKSSSVNSNSSTDSSSMTTNQINDLTDAVACNGKLMALQQISLISSGLMDNSSGSTVNATA